MKRITRKDITETAKQIHALALKAIRKSEGYSDGINHKYENWSPRLRCAMEAIARHLLKNFTPKRKRK